MATQKTLPTTVTVDSFLDTIAEEQVKADCKEIVGMMQKASKEAPVMWGPAIIGFGKYHYKYESGYEGDSCIIGLSPRKQNITLYIGASLKELEPFYEKLGMHKTGKGCVYIKKLADVDKAVLKQMIATSYSVLKKKHA